jgi:hypothetical protein
MECLDGTPCYNTPTPPCCYDIGIVELVARCGGDAGCIRYYSNTATLFPDFPPDTLAVDSLMNMFAFGFQGGLLTYLPLFSGAAIILTVVGLFSYSVSKS